MKFGIKIDRETLHILNMRLILKCILLIIVTVSRIACQGKKFVRITGGGNELEGRVEIYFKGIWGSVCDDNWDINDGHVVCRMLGHVRALRVSCCSKYGPSASGRVLLDDVNCIGHEDSLVKCKRRLAGTHDCDVHRESAGVVCQGKSSALRQNVRLAGAPDVHEGRVEVFHDGEWGAICDDNWDLKDGHVVCSMLGFGLAVSVLCCSQYGISDSKKIWLDDVKCKGHESSIMQCAKRAWGQHNCNNEEVAGVVCKEPKKTQGLIFRLAGGRFPHEGRVEVIHNGVWGAVCDDYWKLRNGHVICRHLGYKRALSVSCCSKYGPSLSTKLFLDDVNCEGGENSLLSCQHSFFGTHNCDSYKETAGVVCDKDTLNTEPPPIFCPNGFQLSKDRSNCTDIDECTDNTHKCIHQCVNTIGGYKCTCPPNFQGNGQDCEKKSNLSTSESKGVRLMYGQGPHEGRVEVWKDGVWGTICDDYWDPRDGHVVCRRLGYRRAKMVTCCSSFKGNHSLKMMLDDVGCNGDEDSLFSCSHSGWGVHDCDDKTEEAGVICTNAAEPTPPVDSISSRTKFRLAGGRTPNEGRVEIFYRNQWGAVCDDSWKLKNGHVICRQLGYERAISVSCCSKYGPIKGGVFWMDDVRCRGNEKSLFDCRRREWGQNDCNKEETAGVVCYKEGITLPTGVSPTSAPTLRITGGPNRHEGRVEVFRDGEWGGVCHKGWELRDGDVVCRSLGYERASSVSCCSEYGPSASGQIWLTDVRCQGYETSFDDCPSRRREYYECTSYDLASVKCLFGTVTIAPTPGIPDIQVRLVGGYFSNEGAVKVLYGKEWGAICDDNWGMKEGHVVCRMLGYKRARSVSCCSKYSAVRSGRIWLDDVDCQGTEDTLAKCTHGKWGQNNCNLNELAGVVCHTDNPPIRSSVVYPPPVKVRLSGGTYQHMGRVEVFYRGEWGAVCDDLWDLNHGHVVCRMLGYKRAFRVSCCSKYGPSVSKKLWLDDVRCTGNERTLMDCKRRQEGEHDCSNKETAGVVCEVEAQNKTSSKTLGKFHIQEKTSLPLSTASPTTIGFQIRTVRIVGSSKFWEGRAEVRHDGKWGAICGTSWNLQAGHVFCRMLGFERAVSVSCCSKYGPHWTFNMLLDGVKCTGNERSILDCAHKRLGTHSCNVKTQAAGLVCSYGPRKVYTPIPRTTVQMRGKRIRLVGGKTPNEGRVEIFYRGEWGAICDDSWRLRNGHVACRMLGYPGAVNVSCCDTHPAKRASRIWMDDVQCKGTEKSLFSCRHRDWGQHNCNFDELAGVVCMLQPRSTLAPVFECGNKPNVPVRFGTSVNGQRKESSEPGHWPWQVLIMNRRGFQFCTGALIGFEWVLTAAHCFDRVRRPKDIIIRLGAFKVSPTSFLWVQNIPATAVYRHPLYGSPVRYSNDIVLIKLFRQAKINRRVNLVCLTNETKLFAQGTNCWTSGWGLLLNPTDRSPVLQQLSVSIKPRSYCRNYRRPTLHESMICAGNSEKGSDSCSGDSGGPLVCQNEGRWYLNGLSSYGGDCKQNGPYSLYSNVPHLIKWAYSIMDRYS